MTKLGKQARIVTESTTRLPSSVIKPSNCNNLRILLVYSRHTDSRAFEVICVSLLSTQSSLTNIAARRFSCCAPPFGTVTVFLHLYALLTVSLVLGLSSRPTCLQNICSPVHCPRLWYPYVGFSHVINSLLTYLLTLIIELLIVTSTAGL